MDKILVTGGNGFLGKNLKEYCDSISLDVLTPSRLELNLLSSENIINYIRKNNVRKIVHLAALCGGIGINKDNPGRFLYENLLIGLNIAESARVCEISKIVNLGTVCSYPKFTKVPFSQSDFWNGYPEETNAPYGIAKKTVMELLKAYHFQYGMNVTNLVPVNLAGKYDNFNQYSSHVFPAIIRKFEESRDKIVLWGTGEASREFLDAADCSEAIIKSLNIDTGPDPINLGSGVEITIKELAEKIKNVGKYNANITWDSSKPDGQPRRCLDTSRAKKILNWESKIKLEDTIINTIKWYKDNK